MTTQENKPTTPSPSPDPHHAYQITRHELLSRLLKFNLTAQFFFDMRIAPYDCKVYGSPSIQLLEGDEKVLVGRNRNYSDQTFAWNTTKENAIDDAIILAYTHLVSHELKLKLIKYSGKESTNQLSLHEDLTHQQLTDIKEFCRQIPPFRKVRIVLYETCSIVPHTDLFERHDRLNIEVLRPVYRQMVHSGCPPRIKHSLDTAVFETLKEVDN